ncbi:L-threonylcarbamoyladenylate synthase, partial [Thauera linaloolentis]
MTKDSGAKPRGRIEPPTLVAIREAAALLRAGDIVGMPTETVYGLAADALNPAAVNKIFAAKGRPADHPLIVHLPSADHLPRWAAAIPKDALALARAFWPGPLTLILKRAPEVPDEVTGGQDTVGLRVPSHSIALAMLLVFGSGIAAPSANRFGRISPTTAAHVREELGERVAMVVDGGPCAVGIESTILDFSRDVPEILRPGAITPEAIARVIGRRPRVRGEAAGGGRADAHSADAAHA